MENKNQSAFAMCMVDGTSGATLIEYGLSKREYFAGLAMQGLLSNSGHVQTFNGNSPHAVPSEIAKYSIQYADELLKQLENGK